MCRSASGITFQPIHALAYCGVEVVVQRAVHAPHTTQRMRNSTTPHRTRRTPTRQPTVTNLTTEYETAAQVGDI